MTQNHSASYFIAVEDFQRARRQAEMERFMARLTGQPVDLLSYEEVREKLKTGGSVRRGLQEIPLDAIIGSVGRYTDFTRRFHPRHDSDQERWARVEVKVTGQGGLPPIEVYQVGEAYFVIDGNHRVSVARQLEAKYIEAYVTEIQTKLALKPDADMDDLILKARYLDFLAHTKLNQLRPEADLTVTVPGQYRLLEQHIELHRYVMRVEQNREIPYEQAVTNWYDKIYSPLRQVIREENILKDFPGRTETDVYLWVSGYRAMLEDALEWGLEPETPEAKTSPRSKSKLKGFLTGRIAKLLGLTIPAQLEPLPGQWRREHLATQLQKYTNRPFRLFSNILVPVNGQEVGWYALHQALGVAKREGGRLLGLHVASEESDLDSEAIEDMKVYFNQHCIKAGVPGKLAIERGAVASTIWERSRWADLIVIRLVYPPSPQPIAKLGSGFHTLIRRCSSPLLVVPRDFVYPLDQALLAYDGSPKAKQALYIATYVAGRWNVPLTVVSVKDSRARDDVQHKAKDYLQLHGLKATFIQKHGPVAETILATAEEHDSSLIIMGSYGFNPLLEIVLGSTVDEVLRTSRRPMLICG